MDLNGRLQNVAVLGAGGKMGSGIALLLAVELAKRRLSPEGRGRSFRLTLVDLNGDALVGVMEYLRAQSQKIAEKMVIRLRELYADRADLVENGEMVQAFVAEVCRGILLSTETAAARSAHLVFEAIVENEEVKVRVFRQLKELCGPDTFFLTNTSSIPIHVLDEQAGLDGRLVGYHFYNPPPVQKLVELISWERTRPELVEMALQLGKVLQKKIIPSNDVAGFIGNGHFTRDGLHALAEVEGLTAGGLSRVEALYAVNRVSQDFLVRPMGILQLLDYVGLDVFLAILQVMNRHIPGACLRSGLLEAMVDRGILGGQRHDGSQKNGFLRYERNAPAGVFDLDRGAYVDLDRAGWCARVEDALGPLPRGWQPWKKLLSHPQREAVLRDYFAALWGMDTLGASLARRYLTRSAEIGRNLVKDGVARTIEDVNGVLMNGFYHLYGPVNDLFPAGPEVSATAGLEVQP